MEKINMYIVTHKKVSYVPKDRIPIFVGNNNSYLYKTDNIGDNIALKNKNYCELTALYWIWKNDCESEYVSIEHYRRFFMNQFIISPIKKKKLLKILDKYDGIQMKRHNFKVTLLTYYEQKHIIDDLKYVEEAISLFYPEYLNKYKEVMNQNKASMCNMIVLSKKKFDNYCEWLFKILFYVEDRIDVNNRDKYQQRVFGFISERLQNVWIEYNMLNMKELPIYYLERSKIKSILKSIKNKY